MDPDRILRNNDLNIIPMRSSDQGPKNGNPQGMKATRTGSRGHRTPCVITQPDRKVKDWEDKGKCNARNGRQADFRVSCAVGTSTPGVARGQGAQFCRAGVWGSVQILSAFLASSGKPTVKPVLCHLAKLAFPSVFERSLGNLALCP